METGSGSTSRSSWSASMQAAVAASFGRPTWWLLALASFLVRGGVVLILLPLISLPTPAALATALSPWIESLAFSRQSIESLLLGSIVLSLAAVLLSAAAFAGSWLDVALLREADTAEELEDLEPVARPSAWRALAFRLAAHIPTLWAVAYATVRLVYATYEELLAPGDPAISIPLRIAGRAPDAIIVVAIAWLLGEVVGGIAMRRGADGVPLRWVFVRALRELVDRRGLATFVLTNLGVLATLVLLSSVAGRAMERVRDYLVRGVDPVSLGAAVLLLVAAWVLGLALLGAALAWRAMAWTALLGAPRAAEAPAPAPAAEETSPA